MYPFIFRKQSYIAYVDSKFQPFTTIWHECELLLSESATAKSCSKSEAYWKTLHAMASHYHKQQKACDDKTSPWSHTNYQFLSTVEKAWLYRMHNAIHASKKRVWKHKVKITVFRLLQDLAVADSDKQFTLMSNGCERLKLWIHIRNTSAS